MIGDGVEKALAKLSIFDARCALEKPIVGPRERPKGSFVLTVFVERFGRDEGDERIEILHGAPLFEIGERLARVRQRLRGASGREHYS